MFLAVNVDNLLYDVTGLVGFCLVPESDESSDDVFNEHLRMMSTINQTKFQYISVPYGHVIVPLSVPLSIFHFVDLQELVAPY